MLYALRFVLFAFWVMGREGRAVPEATMSSPDNSQSQVKSYFKDAAPDDTFPYLTGGELPLVDVVRCGWLLRVRCWSCDKTRHLNGREICAHHAHALTHSIRDWARSLKCAQCGAKRYQIDRQQDAAAHGEFMAGSHLSMSTGFRRLADRLADHGLNIADYLVAVSELPTPLELRLADLGPLGALLERERRRRALIRSQALKERGGA